jgi:hypothetical protein
MKRKLTAGQTSVSLPIFVQDTSSTTGGGLSGLTSGTSGLVAEYRRRGQSAWTAITLTSKTLGTWVSGGIVADGALAGAYELDLPDSVCASGERWVAVRLRGAANMLPCLIEIELDAVEYQTSRFGASDGTSVTLAASQPNYAPATSAQAAVISSDVANVLANLEDVPTNAEFEARTLVAASYGTAANQTTILNRLGAWTGTGVNTILGAFRSLLSKVASTPSDIGGTFDAATDSTEAIRDRGDAAWVTGSSGGGLSTEQEDTLNTIYSQTSQITGSRINITGPVSAAGDITLIVSKDYKVASESELTISVPDTGGALYADFTSATLAASKAFGMSRTNGDADIAGTVYSVTYATNVTTFKVEIDADQLPDTLSLTDDWVYQIQRVTSAGDKVVGAQGAGSVAMRTV